MYQFHNDRKEITFDNYNTPTPWMYIAAIQYLLGIKPKWEGLEIAPCLPKEWKEVRIDRDF